MTFTDKPRPTAAQAGRYLKDLAERVFFTFWQAFGAALLAGGWFDIALIRDLSIPEKAAWSGIAAVLALFKGVVAKLVSRPDSASLAPGV